MQQRLWLPGVLLLLSTGLAALTGCSVLSTLIPTFEPSKPCSQWIHGTPTPYRKGWNYGPDVPTSLAAAGAIEVEFDALLDVGSANVFVGRQDQDQIDCLNSLAKKDGVVNVFNGVHVPHKTLIVLSFPGQASADDFLASVKALPFTDLAVRNPQVVPD